MKNKFIRILSPITISVVTVLNIAVIYFAVFAVKKLIEFTTVYAIFFAVMEVFAIVVAALVTKNVLSQGVKFYDDRLEFTAIDDDNIIYYDDIISIKTEKDDKASLVKNFVDRQSKIIFALKEDKVISVDIGLTTKKTLNNLEKEINTKIHNNNTKFGLS